MKKLFATLVIFAILFTGLATIAHASDSCPVVNAADGSCCSNPATDSQRAACQNYFDNYNTNTAASTSIGSGGTTNTCPAVNPSDGSCCTSNNVTPQQKAACQAYFDNYTVPGQVSSGTQKTSPVNNTGYTGNPSLTPSSADQKAVAACSAIKFNTILDIAIWAKCIIGAIVIPGIFTLALVVFLWGVFKFIRATADADKQEGKQFIYMGLIGLFVMVSVWGIIKIVGDTLGVKSAVPMLQTDYLSPSNASKTTDTGTSSTGTIAPTGTGTVTN